MDDQEQQRKGRHGLAVLRHADEVSGNVGATLSISHAPVRHMGTRPPSSTPSHR